MELIHGFFSRILPIWVSLYGKEAPKRIKRAPLADDGDGGGGDGGFAGQGGAGDGAVQEERADRAAAPADIGRTEEDEGRTWKDKQKDGERWRTATLVWVRSRKVLGDVLMLVLTAIPQMRQRASSLFVSGKQWEVPRPKRPPKPQHGNILSWSYLYVCGWSRI